jgi:hypothetical protein
MARKLRLEYEGAIYYAMSRGDLEGVGVGLAPKGRQGEDRCGQTVAKGNHDDIEMDCRTLANGKLDLRLQSPGV